MATRTQSHSKARLNGAKRPGLRWQAQRDTAFARTRRVGSSTIVARPKAPSPHSLCRRTPGHSHYIRASTGIPVIHSVSPSWRIGDGERGIYWDFGGKVPRSLHYTASAPAAVILGRGCGGKVRLSCSKSTCSSFSGWVWRVRMTVRPSVVGRCTSTICTAQNFSHTARAVNPPATAFKLCGKQACSV